MIGTLSVSERAPLEYRAALDAAAGILAGEGTPMVWCGASELWPEVRQRLPNIHETPTAKAVLWVEPIRDGWRTELDEIRRGREDARLMVVVASRPMARLLPERRSWTSDPLGIHFGGLRTLTRGLSEVDFSAKSIYGFHTIWAVTINILTRQITVLGRTDLGDRLKISGRANYVALGPLAALSTVALLVFRK